MSTKHSQNQEILDWLRTGESITHAHAFSFLGCARLAARINDLRNRGHAIATDMIEQGGKRFASYRLEVGRDGR